MKLIPFSKTVVNERLRPGNPVKVEYHVPVNKFVVDSETDTVSGQVRSYKSDKVIDCIDANSNPTPETSANFSFTFDPNKRIDDQVQEYLEKNIEEIVSK